MLASTKKILEKADKENYAVGHFNINNLEILHGIVRAAEALKAPVILATSEGAIEYAGINFLYSLALTASELSKIPIALHLDHGKDLEIIRKSISLGYSSVMIDASHYPFEKNIRLTKKVVQLAHQKNISVEAELGTIGGKEDLLSRKKIIYTDPEAAKEFIERTGCDFLAVAIGTSHGAYKFKGKAELKINLLREIKRKVRIPLVLHGASSLAPPLLKIAEKYSVPLAKASGVPEAQIRQAIKEGINKINTDTDLRLAFEAGLRKSLKEKPSDFDPRQRLAAAREQVKKVAEHRIKLFGSAGKAFPG